MALNTTKLGLSGVNALFKMYYGRDATKEELNYWSNKSDAELRPKLIPNSAVQLAKNKPQPVTQTPVRQTPVAIPNPTVIKDYNVTGTSPDGKTLMGIPKVPVAPVENTNPPQNAGTLASGNTSSSVAPENVIETAPGAIYPGATPQINETPASGATLKDPITGLDEGTRKRITDFINTEYKDMSQTERDFLIATFVNNDKYTSGATIPTNDQISTWIKDSATLAEADINPYYSKITSEELADYKNKMADIRNEASRYTQQEAASYKQKLAETKQSLRARGLTFSGINRSTLGKETAIGQAGGYNAGIEGTLPGARRMGWEDKSAGWQEQARDIGLAAERELGSTTIGNETGLASPYDLAGNNLDYQAGRTQALYSPSQAGTIGSRAGFNEKPTGAGTTSQHELDRLKAIELATRENITRKALTIK